MKGREWMIRIAFYNHDFSDSLFHFTIPIHSVGIKVSRINYQVFKIARATFPNATPLPFYCPLRKNKPTSCLTDPNIQDAGHARCAPAELRRDIRSTRELPRDRGMLCASLFPLLNPLCQSYKPAISSNPAKNCQTMRTL